MEQVKGLEVKGNYERGPVLGNLKVRVAISTWF